MGYAKDIKEVEAAGIDEQIMLAYNEGRAVQKMAAAGERWNTWGPLVMLTMFLLSIAVGWIHWARARQAERQAETWQKIAETRGRTVDEYKMRVESQQSFTDVIIQEKALQRETIDLQRESIEALKKLLAAVVDETPLPPPSTWEPGEARQRLRDAEQKFLEGLEKQLREGEARELFPLAPEATPRHADPLAPDELAPTTCIRCHAPDNDRWREMYLEGSAI